LRGRAQVAIGRTLAVAAQDAGKIGGFDLPCTRTSTSLTGPATVQPCTQVACPVAKAAALDAAGDRDLQSTTFCPAKPRASAGGFARPTGPAVVAIAGHMIDGQRISASPR
jgi:hypothetical protein